MKIIKKNLMTMQQLFQKKYSWCEIECVEDNKIKTIERIKDENFSLR